MGNRPGFSTVLLLGAIVLVVAIVVGNSMGNRVLGQIANKAGLTATPIPIPSSSSIADTVTSRALWKRRQVLSVATDPAFPDPRITPEPEVPATPRPRVRPRFENAPDIVATSRPSKRTATEPAPEATPDTTYTSPPLPIPIVSHSAEETIAPDEVQTVTPKASTRPATAVPRSQPAAGRTYPSLPPVSYPSLSP